MPVTSVTTSSMQGAGAERSYRYLEKAAPRELPIGPAEESSEARPLQPEFGQMVKSFVADVNDLQMRSGKAIDGFVAGEITDVHQVMMAVQEAGLALDLLLEVRNRTVEAFQEIMRMQV